MSNTAFMSRWDFKKKAVPVLNPELHAVISFNDNSREMEDIRAVIPKGVPNFLCVAKDDESNFSPSLAREVIRFVKENSEKYFVIHCFAGVSRSAAVARWIELHLGTQLPSNLQNYCLYNKHIFDTLERVYANWHSDET